MVHPLIKVAAIQMTSVAEVAMNLDSAHRLLEQASARGAAVAVLPENFAFMGLQDIDKLDIAENLGEGPIQAMLASAARKFNLWIIAGTLPIKVVGDQRVAAASLVFNERGEQVARYDKMHLFDVNIPGKSDAYRESINMIPGSLPVVVDTPAGRVGLSVCYDLRFPELFRSLSEQGATWFVVPSAFTVPTGQAHWEVLLRARAIENLGYVVAAGQCGLHPNQRETYGDSLIVDYWGKVLTRLPSGEGVIEAEFDQLAQLSVRTNFPALQHRRL